MDYSQFLSMRAELSLIGVIVLLFLYDLIAGEKGRRYFHLVACSSLGLHILFTLLFPGGNVQLFGGMYQTDALQEVMKGVLAIGTWVVLMQGYNWLNREDTRFKVGEFYVLTLSTLLGMNFMISAGNFLMFFIGLELASVPTACLVAFDKYKGHSAEAGAKYILTALFASGLMLYGISFIYGTVGTLYFEDLTQGLTNSPIHILALVFFFAGLGFKLSLVPFHLWTADVYQGAPTTVTSYLSVISKGAAAFVLMTILVKVFGGMVVQWQQLLLWVTIASITVANLFALRQQNMKRFLAFSSISQAGYLMLAVISGTPMGLSSLVYYMMAYIAANLAVFGIVNSIEQNTCGKVMMDDYNGLYSTNPKLTLVMTLALFSLAGIPPFAGFFSKFFVFMAAFGAGFHLLVFIALVNTVLSLFYYLRVVKAMYITPNDSPIATFRSDNYMRLSLVVCTVGVLLIGVVSGLFSWLL